jgi:hypothetical protein
MQAHPFHPEITLTRWWPANEPHDTKDIECEGDWLILMSAGGAMMLHHAGDPLENRLGGWVREEYLPVYSGDEDTLRRALAMFCRRGYPSERDDHLFAHTDGIPYIFNWRSFTLWQLGIAQRVFHLFVQGNVEEAWTFGRWAGDQIKAAENAQASHGS